MCQIQIKKTIGISKILNTQLQIDFLHHCKNQLSLHSFFHKIRLKINSLNLKDDSYAMPKHICKCEKSWHLLLTTTKEICKVNCVLKK